MLTRRSTQDAILAAMSRVTPVRPLMILDTFGREHFMARAKSE